MRIPRSNEEALNIVTRMKNDPITDVKCTSPSTRAAKPHSKVLATPAPAQKVKLERLLHEMAKLDMEEEAKARAVAAAPPANAPAKKRPVCAYQIPWGLSPIANSVKIDDPPTKLRIGQLNTFIETIDLKTSSTYWIGITWAEVFYPVVGERPKSLVGSKAYEVVLKKPVKDLGLIVRENVVTTGRVVGVVNAELPHDTVTVKIEDWFVQSDVFKKGRWEQRVVASSISAS